MTGQPSTGVRSLMGMGTPAKGPRLDHAAHQGVGQGLGLGPGLVVVAPDDGVEVGFGRRPGPGVRRGPPRG